MSENLQQLRNRVSQIDRDILNLLNQRQRLVQEIGKTKQQQHLPMRDLKREEDVLQKLYEFSEQQNALLTKEDIYQIYQSVMQAALKLQTKNNP